MIKSILASLVVTALLIGCGAETSTSPTSSSASGSNTTTLDASNLNQITITTTANNVGTSATYYNVTHFVDNASLNNVFNAGTNYTGTIVTTCVRGTATAISVPYACTTTYGQTSSPINIPDSVRNATFNLGETYTVTQQESVLLGSKTTTAVGTFVMQ